MNESTLPVQSTKTLVKATMYAGLIAGVILVTTILPAEYNIDPTGVGKALGLTGMYEQSTSVVKDEKIAPSFKEQSATNNTDTVSVLVPAGRGLEYKFHLIKGDKMEYSWKADNGVIFFDFHGEPQGDTTGFFESFSISTAREAKGTLTAPFTGSHGWYWKNSGDTDINISLDTKGSYQIIGLK
jgi:hypothetical protein